MSIKTLKKDDLPGFVDSLVKDYEVVGPVPKEFKHVFGRIHSFSELDLDYKTTLLPPKKYLLPQKETLIKFTIGDESTVEPVVEPVLETPKRVVFGAHSCDLHGIWLLDDIFAEGSMDVNYASRRQGTYFIGIDCKEPCFENSFCKSMGTLKPGGGYDIFLTDLGNEYIAETATAAGEDMLKYGNFAPANYKVKELYFDTWRKKLAGFPDPLEYDAGKLPSVLTEAYDDFIWDALEERCFDCGACTVVCPTCYCFDMLDEVDIDMKNGRRSRRWDSCQLRDFALLAGGENMRGKRSDRLRHRFLRKGKYFKEKFGRFACVGCGRCGRACLVKIDVLQVFNQLKS